MMQTSFPFYEHFKAKRLFGPVSTYGSNSFRGRLHGRGEEAFAGTGLLAGWDVKRDLAMHVYISYLPHTVYMEISLPERFLKNTNI